ncbi:MAG: PDZ domain-containing protein [Planctomycetota bacterium]|nr:PDZ domain-containing protein [Planctomycetota bacterium]
MGRCVILRPAALAACAALAIGIQASAGDEQEVRVEVKNGEQRVWVNGQEVDPASLDDMDLDMDVEIIIDGEDGPRVLRGGGEFTEKDGNVIKLRDGAVFEFRGGDQLAQAQRRGNVWVGENEVEDVIVERIAGAPVRIGVVLGEVGEAMAAQFGIDPSETVLITDVMDGPAKEAGVKRFDVVLKIDGGGPATAQRLREAVLSRKPGETMEVTVLRGGEKKTIEIKVARVEGGAIARIERAPDREMERERAQVERRRAQGFARAERDRARVEEREQVRVELDRARELARMGRQHAEDAMKRVELQLKQVDMAKIKEQIASALKEAGLDREQMKEVERALAEAMRSVEEMEFNLPLQLERLRQDAPEVRFFGQRGPGGGVIVVPAPPEAPRGHGGMKWRAEDSDQARETDDLSRRLSRLEERMERLEDLLERLADRRN